MVNDNDNFLLKSRFPWMQEISADSHPDQSSVGISDDLPKNVLRILNEGSSPTNMDFHPEHRTVLLGLLIRISFQ